MPNGNYKLSGTFPITRAEDLYHPSRIIVAPSGCWDWRGCLIEGYAAVWYEGRMWKVNRLAHHLRGNTLPREVMVCHKCDNRPCINPDHIFLGSASDNAKDCEQKGRSTARKHLKLANAVRMKAAALVLFAAAFWHFNEQANELEYWVLSGNIPHTCGFVGKASDGMFFADALGSGGASETVSREYNTIEGAQAFVETKCQVRTQ